MRKIFITFGILFLILIIWARKCDNEIEKELELEASQPKKEITCTSCGKNLTNDYNRMEPLNNGNFYCMPCYYSMKNDIQSEMKAEGYN
jgi:hypothetical protein